MALHDPDDLLGVLRVQDDRPRIDPAEPLEQRGLAFHHRQRRRRSEVAEAQHGRAVGDHRHRVALDGQAPGVVGVLGDREADAGDAGGVGAGQFVAGAERDLRVHLDLAAEVEQERTVGDLAHLEAIDLGQLGHYMVGMGHVCRVARDVGDDSEVVGVDDVERRHDGAGIADGRCYAADSGRIGGNRHPDRDRKPGAGHCRHREPLLIEAWSRRDRSVVETCCSCVCPSASRSRWPVVTSVVRRWRRQSVSHSTARKREVAPGGPRHVSTDLAPPARRRPRLARRETFASVARV